ncbi:MAG TPA: hypothetical protein ENI17_09475 [Pseudomonas xinjiangensis]|uniref:Toxin VasX N-terminal region domain-containing protein n=2 Tax=root TaxID=1 RepID=A0A7V1BRK4_9GAMM|nr:hypothetical protein [Halopseudomonas xinjiangensis]HEC47845.1 hypothetical protein [Halopseudomonas xinjiangensis]
MNQATTAPVNFRPASCPLLAAVLPVRYAIGPIDPAHGAPIIDAQSLGLPPVTGQFPELGPDHAQLADRSLGYVPRMLRDGWLYVWQNDLQVLSEYQVTGSSLLQTARSGSALSNSGGSYLLLPAGTPVRLVWSPICWSDKQFASMKSKADIRSNIMREITPGVAPLSGQVPAVHRQIGDGQPQEYTWSGVPEPKFWALNDPAFRRMLRCEQQHYGIVDDPWGVLLDVAALLRARNTAYDKLCHHRRDDWAMAATLESLSEGDPQLRKLLPSSTDYPRLQRTLQEQEREALAVDSDRRRLAALWSGWFGTLGREGHASLDTACGHFDITRPDARDALEASFAAACLGPSATSLGVKAIEQALDLESSDTGKPWLVWAVLGVAQRMGGAEIKQLLHLPENAQPLTDDIAAAGRALALVVALNRGADNLERLSVVKASEALSAAMSPVLGGHLRTLAEHPNNAAMTLMMAMLTRSQQRLDVLDLTPRQSMQWLTEQMNQPPTRLAREGAGKTGTLMPALAASQLKEGIPHLRLVPKPKAGAGTPQPGYGNAIPDGRPPSAAGQDLPPLSRQAAQLDMPRNIGELMDEAPLKTLIALVAVWNLYKSGSVWWSDDSGKNRVSALSALFATSTATSAMVQKLADVEWKVHTNAAGRLNPTAQKLLANALGIGSVTMLLQSVTAGIDTLYFGWEALDSYRAGDLDSAAVQVGLSASNAAYMRVSLQLFRALRIARAAVIAGDAVAIGRGVAAIPAPLLAQTLGLVVTILGGLIALWYTKDTPLESWVKQTRFGTRPADWSDSFEHSLQAFYQMVMPVRMELHRWQDLNPRSGAIVREIRLLLILPGQQEYRQGMLSFSGQEEWAWHKGLLDFGPARATCSPLSWNEADPIPFHKDEGARITPEMGGGIRLRRAYHESETATLRRISGTLIYQPIDGLYLPPIDIDLS